MTFFTVKIGLFIQAYVSIFAGIFSICIHTNEAKNFKNATTLQKIKQENEEEIEIESSTPGNFGLILAQI